MKLTKHRVLLCGILSSVAFDGLLTKSFLDYRILHRNSSGAFRERESKICRPVKILR
jgi:hypothetical protein